MSLTEEQARRYARHFPVPGFGREGQEKLLDAGVLIIGAGGLGSSAALYLAAAGVDTVGIADSDEVELSNLQRQILHGSSDLGRAKVDSAADSLRELLFKRLKIARRLRSLEEKKLGGIWDPF